MPCPPLFCARDRRAPAAAIRATIRAALVSRLCCLGRGVVAVAVRQLDSFFGDAEHAILAHVLYPNDGPSWRRARLAPFSCASSQSPPIFSRNCASCKRKTPNASSPNRRTNRPCRTAMQSALVSQTFPGANSHDCPPRIAKHILSDFHMSSIVESPSTRACRGYGVDGRHTTCSECHASSMHLAVSASSKYTTGFPSS